MERSTNALAELAERLASDIGDKDTVVKKPAIYQDLYKAQRIVAELAKVESLYEKLNAKASNGNIAEAEELAHELHLAKESMFANCRAIAEEGAKDEGK